MMTELVFAGVLGGTKVATIGHPMRDLTSGKRVRLAGERDSEDRYPVTSDEDGTPIGTRSWDDLRAW